LHTKAKIKIYLGERVVMYCKKHYNRPEKNIAISIAILFHQVLLLLLQCFLPVLLTTFTHFTKKFS